MAVEGVGKDEAAEKPENVEAKLLWEYKVQWSTDKVKKLLWWWVSWPLGEGKKIRTWVKALNSSTAHTRAKNRSVLIMADESEYLG